MNFIQKIGVALFTFSLLFFVALLTLSKYQLSEDSLQKAFTAQFGQVPEDKYQAFLAPAQEMLNKSYGSQFGFVADLKKTFAAANEAQVGKFAIGEAEVNQLASLNPQKFAITTVDEVFPKGEEINDFKNKALRDYAGWMDGRAYSSQDELKNNLSNSVANINKDIAKNKGFASYEEKSLLFKIAKKSNQGLVMTQQGLVFFLTIILGSIGALLYIFPKLSQGFPGIRNNGIFQSANNNRGWLGIIIGIFLIAFYILLYWYPEYITSWVILVDPIGYALTGGEASQWTLYGFLYTVAILIMGVRMYTKYRHSPYQLIRTTSVMFFQLTFAFLLSNALVLYDQPYMDLKNIWPLNYDLFTPGRMQGFIDHGNFGFGLLLWGVASTVIAVPVFTHFFGKRWYCSWVCGCGGLAETLGDPYRQLSDKSLTAWKIERYLIHGVLVFAIVMTGMAVYTFFTGNSYVLGFDSYTVKKSYTFLIGSAFAGVIGTGFYPLMGNRVWCRFGCPLAAYLGIVQRFTSRFRITTNGGQCISCGNCSTYCEMGIDVRWYAQRGQNIVRSSCVGCGVCSSVCPRGVLNLENGPTQGRINSDPILLGNDGARVVTLESQKANA